MEIRRKSQTNLTNKQILQRKYKILTDQTEVPFSFLFRMISLKKKKKENVALPKVGQSVITRY